MIDFEEYFAEKILRRIGFLEDLLNKRGEQIFAEVKKLSTKKSDPLVVRFLIDTADPRAIRSHLSSVRLKLDLGRLVEADMAMEQLSNNLAAIEQMNQQPYFRAKSGGSKGGKASKRRQWAEVLADKLSGCKNKEAAWAAIPAESHDGGLEIEGERDFQFYRDGDRLVCEGEDLNGNRVDIGSMSKKNFLTRYWGRVTQAP